jgi:hypothetical protein
LKQIRELTLPGSRFNNKAELQQQAMLPKCKLFLMPPHF